MCDRKIIRKRWFNVISCDLSPPVKPVDIGRIARNAGPAGRYRYQLEPVVVGKKLGRRIAQRTSCKTFRKTFRGYESLCITAHAHIEFVNNTGVEDVDP